MRAPPLFQAGRKFAVGEHGSIFMNHPDGVDLDVVGMDGVLQKRLRWEVPRRMVTRADADTAFMSAEQTLAEMGDPAFVENQLRKLKRVRRAKYRNLLSTVVAGPNGTLLVKRDDLSPIDPLSSSPTSWDLVTVEGAVLGRVELPQGLTPAVLERDYLTGVLLDESHVPSIVQYHLSGALVASDN